MFFMFAVAGGITAKPSSDAIFDRFAVRPVGKAFEPAFGAMNAETFDARNELFLVRVVSIELDIEVFEGATLGFYTAKHFFAGLKSRRLFGRRGREFPKVCL